MYSMWMCVDGWMVESDSSECCACSCVESWDCVMGIHVEGWGAECVGSVMFMHMGVMCVCECTVIGLPTQSIWKLSLIVSQSPFIVAQLLVSTVTDTEPIALQ